MQHNGVDVTAADIRNAYLQAPLSQRDYIVCGLEFGLENIEKKALTRRALYGGKTAGTIYNLACTILDSNHVRQIQMDGCKQPRRKMAPSIGNTLYYTHMMFWLYLRLVSNFSGMKLESILSSRRNKF